MSGTEQGGDDLLKELVILVRELTNPLINAPTVDDRARRGVLAEGDRGLRGEHDIRRERSQLLHPEVEEAGRESDDIGVLAGR